MTTMDMLTFLLSLIGALAWIPSIVDFFKTEKIEIKLDKRINIIVDQINSTISIRLGITCKNKDIFVEKIVMEIVHDNGHKKKYIWGFIAEMLLENKGDTVNFTTQKNSYALGWKFVKDTITDPIITFVDIDYKIQCEKFSDQILAKSLALKENNQDINLLKTDSNYISLLQLYKENCQWLSGNYKGEIEIHTVGNKTFNKSFYFKLEKFEVDYFKDVVYNIIVNRTHDNFIDGDILQQEGIIKAQIKPTLISVSPS